MPTMRRTLSPVERASPSLAWKTTLSSLVRRPSRSFFLSSPKKKRASDRRAAITRWLPARTTAASRVTVPAMVTKRLTSAPVALSIAK